MAAGCLFAALAVGDTVYRISPKAGVTYPAPAPIASVGDISELTEAEDESMNSDLDSLFAHNADGLDNFELAALRELASIAKPHASYWGDRFYKEGSSSVGHVSGFTMKNVSGGWDPCLDRIAMADAGKNAHTGWSNGMTDEYTISPIVSAEKFYGGGTGGGSGSSKRRNHNHSAAHVASQYCPPPASVPEPASLSLVVLGAGALLRRRRAR
jgi:hypothetical protein